MPSEVRPESHVELRRAIPEDTAALARIHLAARRSAPMPPGVHTDDEVAAWMAERVGQDEIWVAVTGGAVVGFARLTDGWLDDLYVDPAKQGQGIGGMLLATVKTLHPDGFGLWVFESNRPARDFYSRHGLVELEHTDGSGNEERMPDVRMVWPGGDPVRFLRGLIDQVDDELGGLLERRAALTRAVQPFKGPGDRPSRDPAREQEIAERLGRHAPSLPWEGRIAIVDAIIAASLSGPGGSVGAASDDRLE
jgi:chorismate mutase/GNAT superfamily N-acetyltransferase